MNGWTVGQYATREGVHERTVRKWIEKGAVAVRRQPGGRIRILDGVAPQRPAATVAAAANVVVLLETQPTNVLFLFAEDLV